jgi:hypothetical protein
LRRDVSAAHTRAIDVVAIAVAVCIDGCVVALRNYVRIARYRSIRFSLTRILVCVELGIGCARLVPVGSAATNNDRERNESQSSHLLIPRVRQRLHLARCSHNSFWRSGITGYWSGVPVPGLAAA